MTTDDFKLIALAALFVAVFIAGYLLGREVGWVNGEGHAERRHWAEFDKRMEKLEGKADGN